MSSNHPRNTPRYNASNITPATAERMLQRLNRGQQSETRKDHGTTTSSRDSRGTKRLSSTRDAPQPCRSLVAANAQPEPEPEPEPVLSPERVIELDADRETPTTLDKRRDPPQVGNQQINAHIQVNQKIRTDNHNTTNHYYNAVTSSVAKPGKALSSHTGQGTDASDLDPDPGPDPNGFLTAVLGSLKGLSSAFCWIVCHPRCAWLLGLVATISLLICLPLYLAGAAGSGVWRYASSISLLSPKSSAASPITPPHDALVPLGPLPTEKALIFPYQDGSRQLILDVQRSSSLSSSSSAGTTTTDIVALYEQYAALGAKIDSDWAEALSFLLTRMHSELYNIRHFPAANVETTWFSILRLAKHGAVVLLERRIQRYAENILAGQRIIQDAKWNLTSSASPSSERSHGQRADSALALMSSLSLSVCAWADVHASSFEMTDGAGNDAMVVCRTLERDQNKRVKDRIELLNAFKAVLDEGQVQRALLEEDLRAAYRWPAGVDRLAVSSVERKIGDLYRRCHEFARKVFYRADRG